MKKYWKKLAILVAAIMLAIPVTAVIPQSTAVVQAATPRLSKTKVSIYFGKSTTLKVKNATGKVKWYSSDKKIVKVTSAGKITGVGVGTAYVYARTKRNTFMCSVTVKLNEKEAKKKISIKYDQTGDYTIAIMKNNNPFAVSVSAKMIFYSGSGRALDTSNDSVYCLGPKQTAVLKFSHPYDSDYNSILPARFKMSYNVEMSYYTSYASKIRTNYDYGTSGIVASVKNVSGKKLDSIYVTCLMYDAHGNLIDVGDKYAHCYNSGSTDYLTFYYPYDSNYDNIIPASVKLLVDSAYQY